ncbi:hypothetical protein PG995_000332 [Apiospora arundinis]
MAYRLNYNVEVRQCAEVQKGLGLFAVHRLSKGLKIMSEAPLLADETRDDLVRTIVEQHPSLPADGQAVLTRMYAGPRDVHPFLPEGAVRDAYAIRPSRLRRIARLNSFEGVGIGCVVSPGFAAVNHDCKPNAFMYYNPTTNLVALHALRDIHQDEELCISYMQESVYLTKAERDSRLTNSAADSEERRVQMKSLRDQLTQFHQAASPSPADTREAISVSRQLVSTLEQEGLPGLEMALCLAEQARMFETLGDSESAERLMRRSLIDRRLCVGFDHPSCLTMQ